MPVSFPERDGAPSILGRPKSLYRVPSDLRDDLSCQVRALLEGGHIGIEIAERPSDGDIALGIIDRYAAQADYREGMARLLTSNRFPHLLRSLVLYERLSASNVLLAVDQFLKGEFGSIRRGDEMFHLPEPVNEISHMQRVSIARTTRRKSMAIIGDGPAALTMGALRSLNRYGRSDCYSALKEGETPRGIWNQKRVYEAGHNTFRRTTFGESFLPASTHRPGSEMHAFLEQMYHDANLRFLQKAERIEYNSRADRYVVYDQRGLPSHYDSVCLCTGVGKPAPLSGPHAPMQTNADSFPRLPIKRWQEPMREDQKQKFYGKTPVIVGLGNSTMEMIGECMRLRYEDCYVEPMILTHYSREAIEHPDRVVMGEDGRLERIYRHPSDLSKVAGDIPKIRERFEFARNYQWFVPGVERWDVHFDDPMKPETMYLKVRYRERGMPLEKIIRNIPMIYALVGYRNDPDFLEKMGCIPRSDNSLDIDPYTREVRTRFEGATGYYALGAVASGEDRRNEEVIPRIIPSARHIVCSDIVRTNSVRHEGALDAVSQTHHDAFSRASDRRR